MDFTRVSRQTMARSLDSRFNIQHFLDEGEVGMFVLRQGSWRKVQLRQGSWGEQWIETVTRQLEGLTPKPLYPP